jgi:hypothetical protein
MVEYTLEPKGKDSGVAVFLEDNIPDYADPSGRGDYIRIQRYSDLRIGVQQ